MTTFPQFPSLFKRTLTVAVVASSVLASTTASAAVYTWAGNGGNWGTNGSWLNNSLPQNSDSVVFTGAGSSATSTVNISRTLTAITFDNAVSRSYTLSQNGSNLTTLGNVTNNSSFRQILNNNLSLGAGVINSGTSGLLFGGQLSGSGAVSKTGGGKLEITGASNGGYTGTMTVNGGTLQLSGGIANSDVVVANGGTLTGANGTTNGFAKSITVNSGGILEPGDGTPASYGVFNTQTTTLNSGAVSNFAVGPVGINDQVTTSGTTTFGGALNIKLDNTPVNFDKLLGGDQWVLFSTGSGNSTGDFSSMKITISGTDYSFSQMGATGLWHTTSAISGYDPQYGFVFSTVDATLNLPSPVNVVAGTLYAVPEPSTIVFAGIGIAMFGWSTLTRRRAKIRQQGIEAVIA